MTIRSFVRLLAVALLLLCSGTARAQGPVTWLFASDIHFNALDDPHLADRLAAAPITQWDGIFATSTRPYAPWGADSNAPLLRLALAQMKKAAPDPEVVIIPGDFLAHNYRATWNAAASNHSDAAFFAFIDKNIAYLAHEFDVLYPHAQFVITLGNNDSPCGNYAIPAHSAFLAHFAQAWAPLVNRGGRAPDFAREFPAFGDYVASLPNGTRVIAVNSNAWSPNATDACDPGNTAVRDVMTWFEQAVAASPAGARTWVLLHIPPGIDAFGTLHGPAPVSLYRPELLARLRAVRAADGAPLGLIVAGHLHNDGFRIVDATPLLLVPSISPIHANNPSFFVARIDEATGTIADYDAYAFNDVPSAKPSAAAFTEEYNFEQSYNLNGFSLASLQQLQHLIRDDQHVRELEADHFVSGAALHAIDAQTWRTYWCTNDALEVAAFSACLSGP